MNNQITAFDRAPDGSLTRRGAATTGGRGTGGAEDSANGLILTNVDGEASPTNLKGAPKFLIALNGASNDISVFENTPAGLELVEREPSEGSRPISITFNRGVAYVLNAEQFICTGLGAQPSITGFTLMRGRPYPGPRLDTAVERPSEPWLHTGGLRQDR